MAGSAFLPDRSRPGVVKRVAHGRFRESGYESVPQLRYEYTARVFNPVALAQDGAEPIRRTGSAPSRCAPTGARDLRHELRRGDDRPGRGIGCESARRV